MSDATCSDPEGCDRPARAKGLCTKHYQRARKGRPILPPREKRKCAVDDCSRIASAVGYCNRHYENLRKYGDPIPRKDRPLEVRLRETGWTVTESGCWEWNGKRNDHNYGLFSAKKHGYENDRAHRAMSSALSNRYPMASICGTSAITLRA